MNYMEFIWLAVAVVAAVVEAAVPALVSIWFVPGSILALAASLLGGPLWLQMALFVGATVLAILCDGQQLGCPKPFPRGGAGPRGGSDCHPH